MISYFLVTKSSRGIFIYMRYNPLSWEQKLYLTLVILGRVANNLLLIAFYFMRMKYYQTKQWLYQKRVKIAVTIIFLLSILNVFLASEDWKYYTFFDSDILVIDERVEDALRCSKRVL